MLTLKQKAYDFSCTFKIALDGPAASGKGTIARILAEEFQLLYIQSSIVYRGLACVCIKEKIDLTNLATSLHQISNLSTKTDEIHKAIQTNDLSDENISKASSIIAAIPQVRQNLGLYLKQIVNNATRLIMEGRDIGTVIMPEADLKLFITADNTVRAKRRYKQLLDSGKQCILTDILNQIIQRDQRDTTRAEAPLLSAKDAVLIDTSELDIKQVIDKVLNYLVNH